MNKALVFTGAVAVLLVSMTFVVSGESAQPEKGILIGTAIELSTYAMQGNNAESMVFRAEHGFPVGLIEEETGELFICVFRNPAPASSMETANKCMTPLMGKKVVLQGLVYRSDSFNLIRIGTISEY